MINRTLQQNGNLIKNHNTLLIPPHQKVGFKTYKLFASVIHHGNSLTIGHYSAFIQIDNRWFEFNDSDVFQVNFKRVKKISKGYENSSVELAVHIDNLKHDEIIKTE